MIRRDSLIAVFSILAGFALLTASVPGLAGAPIGGVVPGVGGGAVEDPAATARGERPPDGVYSVQLADHPGVTMLPGIGSAEAVAPVVIGIGAAVAVSGIGGAAIGYSLAPDARNQSALTNASLRREIAMDAYSMRDAQENYISDTRTNLELLRNDAREEARRVYLNERASGASHAEAVSAAKTRVDDMYAKVQAELLRDYERQIVSGGGIRSMERQTDELGYEGDVRLDGYEKKYSDTGLPFKNLSTEYVSTRSYTSDARVVNDSGYVAYEYPMVNGSNHTVRVVTYDNTNYGSWEAMTPENTVWDGLYIEVKDPDTGKYVTAFDNTRYVWTLDNITTQRDEVQSTLGNTSSGYLSDIETSVQNNGWNWTDLSYAPVDYENTSFDDRQEYLDAYLGSNMDGPGPGTTVTIEYTVDGSSYTETGHLYTTWAPSTDPDNDTDPEWVANETYDAAQGLTYLATDDDNLERLQANFSVVGLQRDGQDVPSVTHERVRVDTTSTADLKNETDDKRERINEIEEAAEDDGAVISLPGPDGFDGLGGGIGGLLVLAGAAYLLLQARSGGSGGTTIINTGRRD
jgi:hypothetical protein